MGHLEVVEVVLVQAKKQAVKTTTEWNLLALSEEWIMNPIVKQ